MKLFLVLPYGSLRHLSYLCTRVRRYLQFNHYNTRTTIAFPLLLGIVGLKRTCTVTVYTRLDTRPFPLARSYMLALLPGRTIARTTKPPPALLLVAERFRSPAPNTSLSIRLPGYYRIDHASACHVALVWHLRRIRCGAGFFKWRQAGPTSLSEIGSSSQEFSGRGQF